MAQDMYTPAASGVGGPPGGDAEGRGWSVFAGVMFLTVAAANTLYGIAAIVDDAHFAGDELLVGDLTMWGILSLCFAFCQLSAGVLILRRTGFGAFIGIILATLHGMVALASIGAYPLWTTIVIVIDGLILYGLTVHGGAWQDAETS